MRNTTFPVEPKIPEPQPERSREPASEHDKPSPKTDNPETDVGFFDGGGFTDEDVGDGDYYDDYGEDVDEDDVLGGSEGGDDEYEDNTV